MRIRTLRLIVPAAALLSGVLAGPVAAPAWAQATAVTSATRAHVEVLASERFEGRLAGSEGERLAAEYLVEQLTRLGARPLPGTDGFRLPFSFTAGVKDAGTTLTVTREGAAPRRFDTPGAVQALSFSDNGEVSGEVVFAGYGLVVPESQNFGYDSYATLDVTDKVVVVLRYFPEDADAQTRAILARYSDLRYKAMQARQRGARAMLVVTGPRSPNAGQVVPMSFDTAPAGSGIVAASIGADVTQALFTSVPDRHLEEVQQALDTANPHVAGFSLPGVTVSISTAVERQRQTGYNVVGYLPATRRIAVEKPWLVLGAHYDHLGRGTHGNSLARGGETGMIHHGADDNASGTAAVLAIGETLRDTPRNRHLVLAFWSAEEIGLIGSNAFVTDPPIPVGEKAAYFNFDMVGRMRDNRLTLQATGTSPGWGRLIEQANVRAGFDLQLMPDPYQPTDVASFNQVNVPSLSFFTGTHEDYHRPSDTADRINYEDLDRIVAFAASLATRVMDLQDAPTFTRVEQTVAPSAGRSGIRIFTGTIPDYATDVKGLLLGGVIAGGPADEAGLQKGDVIVAIGEQSITNIYDYTFALDLLRIGQPVTVVYLRGTERRETTLTPAARR
jgi:Zn-dependent M28 family amino/carboxypeptidase